jgi:hypothetical protein
MPERNFFLDKLKIMIFLQEEALGDTQYLKIEFEQYGLHRVKFGGLNQAIELPKAKFWWPLHGRREISRNSTRFT